MRVGPLWLVTALSFASISIPGTTSEVAAQNVPATAGAASGSSGNPAIPQAAEPAPNAKSARSAPVLIKQVDPQFSEEARQKGASGVVLVNLIVDTDGQPQNVHVLRGLGMGLDENAVEAVRQFRFKPAMENNKPVAMAINIEVHFGSTNDDTSAAQAQDSAAAQQERAQLAASLGVAIPPAANKTATSVTQRRHILSPQALHVIGQPMSATRTLDYEPAANSPDPNPYHAEEKFFRDSAGRTRSEIANPDRQPTIDIFDYVAHLHYHWIDGSDIVEQFALKEPALSTATAPPLPANAPQIEGVPTRHTTTITEGVSTVETWYSPDLRLTLVSVVDQTGVGKITVRYSHIDHSEPPASLFQVPLDLTIQNMTSLAQQPALATNAPAQSSPSPTAATQPGSPTNTSLPSSAATLPSTGAPAPAYESDPKFQQAVAAAKQSRITIDERIARWKNANKLAKGECVGCLHEIIALEVTQSQWKDAANTAGELDAIATQPREQFYAESQRATALLHTNNDEPKPDQVKDAEASLRSALAITPTNAMLTFTEGRALAILGRDDEARAMFQKFLDLARPSDPYRMRAQHFIEDPQLAAMRMAPAFTLKTLDGQQISLDNLVGKVVLLDFWATWCGPCMASLPEIQRIVAKFSDQPLVVISISSDSDEAKWKSFIQTNRMTWPQYRDADGALSRAYGVNAIPHYFSIDPDGVLQSVKVGSNSNVEGEIKKLLNRAHDAEKKKAKEADHVASGAN